MGEIKIDAESIGFLTASIKKSKENMDTSVEKIGKISKSSGIMLTEYVDRIGKISELLESYKELLDKDMEDIIASKDRLVEMDKGITTMYQGR